MKNKNYRLALLPLALLSCYAQAQTTDGDVEVLDTIIITAEQQLQQSLGVSKITADDIAKRPVTNDISEIVRTMPGVNLTGNSASGQRGNKRQIDIRGMGPENTLILIDGRPVTSRNSARMGWRGERDTRGDSNWVPAEEIESIEVIRGPAAARYGSGAAGGVVNIITKKVSDEFHGAINYYTNQPEDSKEGSTNRVNFNISGPIVKDVLSFRLYGNYNKTDADATDINSSTSSSTYNAAGRDGVTNKDLGARLAWRISPQQTLTLDANYSRQGNIYTGDTQNNTSSTLTQQLANDGAENSRIYRQSYALTHEGTWSWGNSRVIAQFDRTNNSRYEEGLTGGPEGMPTATNYVDSLLKTMRFSGEAHIPFTWGVDHVLTVGAEYENDSLSDPSSMRQGLTDQGQTDIFTSLNATRGGKSKQTNWAVFVEDNISLTDRTQLIPTLRFDHNSQSGANISPGLNISHQLNSNWTIKGGIARAYKAPNLYQSTDNYLLYTRGNGCPVDFASTENGKATRCYLLGNSNLKPETSINKEIGVEYANNGYLASLAYFHNAYKNKIISGDTILERYEGTSRVSYLLQWENAKRAVVEGLEGNVTLPFTEDLKWVNNFTYMLQSKDKTTNNPLSVIPKYTINSTLSWQVLPKLDTLLTFTYYGRQKPREFAYNRTENTTGLSHRELGSYGVWGISAGYQFTKNASIRFGVSNIFDKQIYRDSNNSSAQSYNEPGRAYYANLKFSF